MRKVLFMLVALAFMAGGAEAAKKAPVTDGVYRTYYPSGALQKEENYKNKELAGRVSEYYENGKLKSTVTYVADLREGRGETYYETGVVKTEGVYKKGALQGSFREYDGSGNLSGEKNYKDGVLQGLAKTYYPSGAVLKQMYYKKAVLDGTAIEFFEDGRPKAEESYKDGALLDRREFEATESFETKPTPSASVDLPTIKTGLDEKAAPGVGTKDGQK